MNDQNDRLGPSKGCVVKPNLTRHAGKPIALVLFVLLFTVSGCNFGRSAEPASVPVFVTPAPMRVLHAVQRGTVAEELVFAGRIDLAVEEELFFGRAGRVGRLYVESGAAVYADMPLAELDAQDLAFDVEDAQLQVALAQQRLDEAEETWRYDLQNAELELAVAQERLALVRAQANVPAIELWIQEVRVQQAELSLQRLARGVDAQYELQLSRAMVGLRQAQSRLASARLLAPFDGQVRFYEPLREGAAVSAYDPVAVVFQPDALEIDVNLIAGDLEMLFEGMPVEIGLSSRPDVRTSGTIRALPQPFGGGAGSGVKIAFADEEELSPLFRSGAGVTVRAELARADDVLWIPPAALHGFRDNYFVIVWEDDREREVPVRVGLHADARIEVTGDLRAGQQLVGP